MGNKAGNDKGYYLFLVHMQGYLLTKSKLYKGKILFVTKIKIIVR